jgi:RimJ/RimL family protein N-acetyltransferase
MIEKFIPPKEEVHLVPLNPNHPDHISWIYKVRTHEQVAAHFFAPPPRNFLDHIQFLSKCITTRERDFFIIYAGEQMAGYCQIINHTNASEIGLALHPVWQGKGIGSKSITLLLDYVKSIKPEKPITLIAKKDNIRALKLYKKHQFIITTETENELKMCRI